MPCQQGPARPDAQASELWCDAQLKAMGGGVGKGMAEGVEDAAKALLGSEQRERQLKQHAKAVRWTRKQREKALYREVHGPVKRMKEGLGRLDPNVQGLNAMQQEVCNQLLHLLHRFYPQGYQFAGGALYEEAKVNPFVHWVPIMALYRVEQGLDLDDCPDLSSENLACGLRDRQKPPVSSQGTPAPEPTSP